MQWRPCGRAGLVGERSDALVERQVLRQLVGAANRHHPAAEQEPTAAHRQAQRALFKFIRSTLTAHSDEHSSSDTS